MACCGQSRRKTVVQPFTIVRPVARTPNQLGVRRARARTRSVGDNCIYCGTKIEEKVKRTAQDWVRVGWCPKCRLEV